MTADLNADLVEMLRAGFTRVSDTGLLGAMRDKYTRDAYERILAWANARRDAAVVDRDAEIARLREQVEDLKSSVIAFAGPWAAQYARDHRMPRNHLHPTHYDILKNAGARMDDFTRAALEPQPPEPSP